MDDLFDRINNLRSEKVVIRSTKTEDYKKALKKVQDEDELAFLAYCNKRLVLIKDITKILDVDIINSHRETGIYAPYISVTGTGLKYNEEKPDESILDQPQEIIYALLVYFREKDGPKTPLVVDDYTILKKYFEEGVEKLKKQFEKQSPSNS